MKSKNGPLLALTAGITDLVFSFLGVFIAESLKGWFPGLNGNLNAIQVIFYVIFPFIMGILFILVSLWMKKPNKVKTASVISIVLGILNLPITFIPGVIGILAGGIGLSEAEK